MSFDDPHGMAAVCGRMACPWPVRTGHPRRRKELETRNCQEASYPSENQLLETRFLRNTIIQNPWFFCRPRWKMWDYIWLIWLMRLCLTNFAIIDQDLKTRETMWDSHQERKKNMSQGAKVVFSNKDHDSMMVSHAALLYAWLTSFMVQNLRIAVVPGWKFVEPPDWLKSSRKWSDLKRWRSSLSTG